MSAGNWKEVNPSEPCQICGKRQWCGVTVNGDVIKCHRRGDSANYGKGLERQDKNGAPYWIFFTRPKQTDTKPTRSHAEGKGNPASPEEADLAYRALLQKLDRGRAIAAELDRRGVPPDARIRTFYRLMPPPKKRWDITRRMVADGLEPLMARTPGFFVAAGKTGDYWTIAGCSGLVIPVCDPRGRIGGLLIRPDDQNGGAKYLWLTSNNKKRDRHGAKARPIPHVPFGWKGDTATVRLTEGALKADIATAIGGVLTIGLPGLHSRAVGRTLEALKVKTVRLCFDADAMENQNVARAIAHHHKTLSRNFVVVLERWDVKDGKGIDDLLAKGKAPELLTGEAVVNHITATTRAADESVSGGRSQAFVSLNEADTIREVVNGLAKNDPGLYQRGGTLGEVVVPPAVTGKSPEAPRIVQLQTPNIRTRITDAVVLMQRNGATTRQVGPPDWLAPGVRALNYWPGIRPLTAVLTSPVLRPDGTIHQEPGYDPATGILYIASGDFAPIPENPTPGDSKAAVEVIRAGVSQFQWEDKEGDFSAWLAEVVTVTVRYAIDGPCPLFFHTANAAGSGKTALAKAAAVIGTGREMPIENYPINDGKEHSEELRKLATAAAMEGHTCLLIDNVPRNHGFGSSALDGIITSTVNAGRQLQTNSAPCREAHTVWVFTGNNIYPIGDTGRRSIAVRLCDLSEHPEERAYVGPEVVEWAKAERGKLFTAALMIAAAYIRAGRPGVGCKPMGSFEAWSALVRSALIWCELPDPYQSRDQYASEDPERERAANLIALLELVGGGPISGKDIAERTREEIRHVIPANGKPIKLSDFKDKDTHPLATAFHLACPSTDMPDSGKLGFQFRKFKNRVVDGKWVQKDGENREGKTLWKVAASPASPRPGMDESRGIENAISRTISRTPNAEPAKGCESTREMRGMFPDDNDNPESAISKCTDVNCGIANGGISNPPEHPPQSPANEDYEAYTDQIEREGIDSERSLFPSDPDTPPD